MTLAFGLTLEDLDQRANSIGASDARIICNSDEAAIAQLWALKRGELADRDDLNDVIHCQFGNYVEGFHCEWFERRTGLDITRRGEFVTSPEFPGLHVTLDGWIEALEPSRYENKSDFSFTWGSAQPAAPVRAVWEAKWRDPHQFKAEQQVAEFSPQVHQAMAITGAEYAVLSTLTGSLKIVAHVIPFDPFYWAECLLRIESFRESVAKGTPPLRFKPMKTPEGVFAVETAAKTVDMSKGKKANMWNAFAITAMEEHPSADEAAKFKRFEKAKDELKRMVEKDVGIAHGNGITIKRDRGGKMHFTFDEQKLAEVREQAKKLAEADEQENEAAA